MNYSQKLRDPRWQRKRLQILERDKWSCKACLSTTKNLQVHHLFYAKLDPWEYPDHCYQTLCEDCHAIRQKIADPIIEEIRTCAGEIPTERLGAVLQNGLDVIQHGSDFYTGKLFECSEPTVGDLPKKVYLAGKIGHNDWRHKIVDRLRGVVVGVCGDGPDGPFPLILERSIFNRHHYVGPFFISCDHGCFHGPNSHGAAGVTHDSSTADPSDQIGIRDRALAGIKACDLFFAYLESEDCFGTLFEIGYASAIGKKMVVVTNGEMRNLWFSLVPSPRCEVFDITFAGNSSSPELMLAKALGEEDEA